MNFGMDALLEQWSSYATLAVAGLGGAAGHLQSRIGYASIIYKRVIENKYFCCALP
jgi:hypothetical protein